MTLTDPVISIQLTENEVRFYREEGYLYLPGVIDAATVAALTEEVVEIMASAGKSLDDLKTNNGARGSLVQSGQYLAESDLDAYVNSPHLLSIASQLMEGESKLYMPFTAVKSGGGGGAFHFHQDNQYTRFDGPGINLWLSLVPMTPENGGLMVVPRSHLHGTEDSIMSSGADSHRKVAQDPTRFLPIRMSAGDLIIFSRLTIHGSGPNTTDEPRFAYAVQFNRNDVSAVWDGEAPRKLSEHQRWQTGPVEALTVPSAKSQDGH